MKRRFPFHSNLVWPPPALLGLFIVLYGLVSVSFWLIERSVPGNAADISRMPEVITFREVILGFTAALYAAYRLVRFHPASNRAYAAWLKLSPWTADRPLPAGPVHLVWQDAAVVGVLTAIAVWHHLPVLLPVLVFIFVYLAGFTLLLALTRRWGPCLVLGFLWPALILPILNPPSVTAMVLPMLCILFFIICVIWYGHRRSLKAFPWEFMKISFRSLSQAEVRIQGLGSPSGAGTQYNLGWPYLMLSPKVRPPSISQRTNLALGALAGWWSYCIFCFMKASGADPMPGAVILFFAIIAALARLGVYAIGVSTPFNLWGRISAGRLVVPGYDKIFVTPLAIIAAAIVGSIMINRSSGWNPLMDSIVIAVLWWILFGGGPTLRSWALTGQFRIRPPAIVNANKQMTRPV
jgi:hypothetical protein